MSLPYWQEASTRSTVDAHDSGHVLEPWTALRQRAPRLTYGDDGPHAAAPVRCWVASSRPSISTVRLGFRFRQHLIRKSPVMAPSVPQRSANIAEVVTGNILHDAPPDSIVSLRPVTAVTPRK